MKKSIFLCLILCCAMQGFSYPILGINESGKGLFGFSYVHGDVVTVEGIGKGWILDCAGSGFSKCKPPTVGILDPTDDVMSERLLDEAFAEIDRHNNSGSIELRVVAGNETFIRHYTVTWNCDQKGDGTIVVDRTDEK